MTDTIMPAFVQFPTEGNIIGRLMASYGELELELWLCVNAIRNDFDTVFKVMFRPRGETQRIGVADAIGRQYYRTLKLGTHFEEAVGGIRYCLKIRNQFAHCQWHDDNTGKLGFVELENLARQNKPVSNLQSAPIKQLDCALLQEQEAYFVYVARLLRYLNFESRKRAGKLSTQPLSIPKKGKRPNLCIP